MSESSERMNCPSCQEMIQADAILCRFCGTGISKAHFSECRSCGEMIRKEAIFCRFCKRPNNPQGVPTTGKPASSLPTLAGSILRQLRDGTPLPEILETSAELLAHVVRADRCVVWQIKGDQVVCTQEYTSSGHTCFIGNVLGEKEAVDTVVEFLSRFPDDSGAGVISVNNARQDSSLTKCSPTMASLIELGDVQSRCLAQLRSKGIFLGFVEVQCNSPRMWSHQDATSLADVAEALSCVVQQQHEVSVTKKAMEDLQLINQVVRMLNQSKEVNGDALDGAVSWVAKHEGFLRAQLFLYEEKDAALVPKLHREGGTAVTAVKLSAKDNPLVTVFESGRPRFVNSEYTRQGDPFFGHDAAVVVPLATGGNRIGVLGLWALDSSRRSQEQHPELLLTIADILATFVQNKQLRGDQDTK